MNGVSMSLSHGTDARHCNEPDVLVHCLAGRQNTSAAMLQVTGSSSYIINTSFGNTDH